MILKGFLILYLWSWHTLQDGVYYKEFVISDKYPIHVIKVEPNKSLLVALSAKVHSKKSMTVKEWCEKFNLVVATNAGMYATDYLTHVGYMRIGNDVLNPRWVKNYFSVFAFNPLKPNLPPAMMIDLDLDNKKILQDYSVVIQNLRLIKYKGKNVWSPSSKKWSESALAMDEKGNVLFIFSIEAFSMYELNKILLSLPLNIVRAMHLEGGPPASLSIHSSNIKLDLMGKGETEFLENDSYRTQYPIPSIIGVKRK